MRFYIDTEILKKFPTLNIGAIIAKNLDNTGNPQEINSLLLSSQNEAKKKYSLESLSQDPKIESWRKAYSVFGGKPKENKCSVENLYRLILVGKELSHINKLVDIYNIISLNHIFPLGGEDLDKTKGDIILTFAKAGEPPVMLLGDKDPRPPHAGEVIYKDDISAICRRWNWREAERTKLTEDTKNCILVIESLDSPRREIENATDELKNLVSKFCGGSIASKILDKDEPEMVF